MKSLFLVLSILLLWSTGPTNAEPVTLTLAAGAAVAAGASAATGIPVTTLISMIVSGIMGSVGVGGFAFTVYNKKTEKQKEEERKTKSEAIERWNENFTSISFSMETTMGHFKDIVIPLMLIINRDHREIRKIFCSANHCPAPTQEELDACPYGVEGVVNPIDPTQALQLLPIPTKVEQLPHIYDTVVNLMMPCPGAMLWLTPNLFVRIDAAKNTISFNYTSDEVGAKDWTEISKKISFLYGTNETESSKRLQRSRDFLNGTIEGDRGSIAKLSTPNTKPPNLFPPTRERPPTRVCQIPPKPPNCVVRLAKWCWGGICCVGRGIASLFSSCCCFGSGRNPSIEMTKLK
jgi:hypothetical protein